MSHVHIRYMTKADLDEVVAIDNASFPTPWDRQTFLDQLRQRSTTGLAAFALSDCGHMALAGYMLYDLCPKKIDVTTLAVAKPYRRCGIGSKLLGKVKQKLTSSKFKRLIVYAEEENLAAQLFLRANGLVCDRQRKFGYRFVFRAEWVVEELCKIPNAASPVAKVYREF